MTLPGRTSTGNDYRYGFQGQEKDDELKGEGNSLNYTFRMHDPRVGRFFARDPLEVLYSWNSPYVFSENNTIRFIELEGLEKAEPAGFFETGWNIFLGNTHKTRMQSMASKLGIDESNIQELPNDTYVFHKTFFSATAGKHETVYYIFRKAKKVTGFRLIGYIGEDNDDYHVTESQFLEGIDVEGAICVDGPGFGGGSSVNGIKSMATNSKYSFRQLVGLVEESSKKLKNWASNIRFGKADVSGISKDVLNKGFHIHFPKLQELELGLKPLADGKIGLAFLKGNASLVDDAVKVFNQAMGDKDFRKNLLVQLKSTLETLKNNGLRSADDIKRANDKAVETSFLIKALTKMD